MIRIPRNALALGLAATLLAAAPALSFAQAQSAPAAPATMQGSPSELVLQNTRRVLETLEARRAEFTRDRAALQRFVSSEFDTMFDRDYAARQVLVPLLKPLIERAWASGHQENFKSVLQQHAQQHFEDTPAYVVLDEKGPDHSKCFEICVEIGARRFRSCWGASKKQAEQQAALNALHELGVAVEDGQGHVTVVRGDGGK